MLLDAQTFRFSATYFECYSVTESPFLVAPCVRCIERNVVRVNELG